MTGRTRIRPDEGIQAQLQNPRPIYHLSDGRGGGTQRVVQGDLGADWTAVAAAAGEDSMIVQHVENSRCQYQGRWLRCASEHRAGTHKAGKRARITAASDKNRLEKCCITLPDRVK